MVEQVVGRGCLPLAYPLVQHGWLGSWQRGYYFGLRGYFGCYCCYYYYRYYYYYYYYYYCYYYCDCGCRCGHYSTYGYGFYYYCYYYCYYCSIVGYLASS